LIPAQRIGQAVDHHALVLRRVQRRGVSRYPESTFYRGDLKVLRLLTAGAVVGFFFAGSTVAHAAPTASKTTRTCDASVLPDCDALAKAPLDARGQLSFGTPRDGGAIFNSQAYWSNLRSADQKVRKAVADAQTKLMESSPAKEARARAVAEKVRAKAIDLLKMRLPDSPERALLIDRLTSVTIDTSTNPFDTCGPQAVPKGFPNLGYSAQTHTVYICTAATNTTEDQLVHSLTHELGHVISPCMAQSKAYKVDRDQLFRGPLVECSNSFYYDDDGNPVDPDDSVMTLVAFQPERIVQRQLNPSFQKLLGCGILKEVPKSSVPSSEVFSETKSCLLKKFRPALEQTDAFKLARVTGASTSQLLDKFHASGEDVCASDFDESFADSFGASLMGQIALERNWSENDLQIAVLLETGFSCYEKTHGRVLMGQYELASMRIKAALNNEETAKRLRCEVPKDANLCPLKFSQASSGKPEGAKQGPTQKPAHSDRSVK